jgi:proteasome lid subunit RPN8/RPN11
MSFSIVATTRRLLAPNHELSCSWWTWRQLLSGLRARGRYERESGAFLLGRRSADGSARIDTFILYDDLDPHVLDTGIIRFDGTHFGQLWEYCRESRSMVIADMHTHPGSPQQSFSDRDHPMITQPDHIALIVPRFARDVSSVEDVGIYRYLGAKRWREIPREDRRRFFHIGL